MKRIVIIGGGFCGSVTAINLARLSTQPLHLTVLDQSHVPGRGVAYSTQNSRHLLNVVARNMSALADQPNHFVEWLQTRSEYLALPVASLRETFVPRRVYGDYLQSLFQWQAGSPAAGNNMRMEFMPAEASDLRVEPGRVLVSLADGRVLAADKVVLAVGNQPPAPFRLRGLDHQGARYIGNPWNGWEQRLPAHGHDLLLIGTGLTMVDTFLTLQNLDWRGKIMAVSRNGLLPLAHYKGFEYPDPLAEETGGISLVRMLAIFKQHYRAIRAQHLNPAIVVDKLRPHTQRLWKNFSRFEKRQFNRHLRTRWNVVRHRVAPEIHAQLCAAIAQHRLEVVKGRLTQCEELPDKMRIEVRGSLGKRVIEAGAMINCTGPQEGYVGTGSSLFDHLLARGTIQPDDMNMGIKVAPDFSVVDAAGKPSETLFALGALQKGTLWETVAVPELRSQAFRLAGHITSQLAEQSGEKSPIAEISGDVLEYSI